ncbi:MAG: aminotransferase class V-fold PLP-dependent enzyme [Bacteroidota bacterium]
MISFYPGPSRVEERIPEYVQDAYEAGILSINHRSDEFMELAKNTIHEVKAKLDIPDDYSVFFTSAATECWEIIAQSLIKNASTHFFNGAFGEKWFKNTQKINANAVGQSFDVEEALDPGKSEISPVNDVICLTQNETSNGTQVHNSTIEQLRAMYPDQIIAADATSSMAGIQLEFTHADVWYASVQKCFGLPAGLAVIICSPRAIQRALEINETQRYNSLSSIIHMIDKYQTTHTPNIMGIYLLNRVMGERKSIGEVARETSTRFKNLSNALEDAGLQHLIQNQDVRSYTVLPVTGERNRIQTIKTNARKEGIILGNGYGLWKETTFRIANFPAIKHYEIDTLIAFLKKNP